METVKSELSHGFSALVEPTLDGRTRRVLFDAGITPDGLIGNLDRLGIAPDTELVTPGSLLEGERVQVVARDVAW